MTGRMFRTNMDEMAEVVWFPLPRQAVFTVPRCLEQDAEPSTLQ